MCRVCLGRKQYKKTNGNKQGVREVGACGICEVGGGRWEVGGGRWAHVDMYFLCGRNSSV